MNTDGFAALARAASESRVGRAAAIGAAAVGAAWTRSRATAIGHRLDREWSALSLDERVSAGALVAGSASIAYWAIQSMTPPYFAAGIPHAWFLGFGMLAFAVMGFSESVAQAWPQSGVARLVRWLLR